MPDVLCGTSELDTSWLRDNCPRLALARDQHIAWLAAESHAAARRAHERYKAEKLLAHRELQFLRAGGGRSRKYVAERARKLAEARRIMERFDDR